VHGIAGSKTQIVETDQTCSVFQVHAPPAAPLDAHVVDSVASL